MKSWTLPHRRSFSLAAFDCMQQSRPGLERRAAFRKIVVRVLHAPDIGQLWLRQRSAISLRIPNDDKCARMVRRKS
jgi:hypothetical protein